MSIDHRTEIEKLTFRALALRQSKYIYFDRHEYRLRVASCSLTTLSDNFKTFNQRI